MSMKTQHNHSQSGFTLIEVIAVVVIAGILATIAINQLAPITDRIRLEETKMEMDLLATAIAGNSKLNNNGVRADFGYIGDVGALPPDLDALITNPGSYSTWKGPYIKNRLQQINDDYKKLFLRIIIPLIDSNVPRI